jgi:menaquinone-dependent protoporphyrinogen oxidase
VAYATKNGSTQQVAEAIGTAMTANGWLVHVAPARSVDPPLSGWDLVVLGAPVYSGRWHRDARRFLRRHQARLGPVRVAVFGMGPRSDEAESWRRSRAQLDRALARYPWLAPIEVGHFGGVDPPRRRSRPRRDMRDWNEIRDWTQKVIAVVGE